MTYIVNLFNHVLIIKITQSTTMYPRTHYSYLMVYNQLYVGIVINKQMAISVNLSVKLNFLT